MILLSLFDKANKWKVFILFALLIGSVNVCVAQPDRETVQKIKRLEETALRAQERSALIRRQLNSTEAQLVKSKIRYDSLRVEFRVVVNDAEERNKRMYHEMVKCQKEQDSLFSLLAQSRVELTANSALVDSLEFVQGVKENTISDMRVEIDSLNNRIKEIVIQGIQGSLIFFVRYSKGDDKHTDLIDPELTIRRSALRKGNERIGFSAVVVEKSSEFRLKYQIVNMNDPATGTTDPVFEAPHDVPIIADRSDDYNRLNLQKLKLFQPKRFSKGEYMIKYEILAMTGNGPEVTTHGIQRIRFFVD